MLHKAKWVADHPLLGVAHGEELDIVGVRDIKLENGCVLRDILYAPEATSTLLSVSRTNDLGWSVHLSPEESQCCVLNNDTVKPLSRKEGTFGMVSTVQSPSKDDAVLAER